MAEVTPKLSKTQQADIEEFLDLFAGIEVALKKKLRRRANDTTGVGALINEYVAKNPFWTDSANRLRHLADIRNVMTHQRGDGFGFPVAVAPFVLDRIREIKDRLGHPEPVSARYRREVETVSPEASLADVLALAFKNGFSQFPVVAGSSFRGLITENEITRWLGRQVRDGSTEVNLAAVTVERVIEEKDDWMRGIAIFHFEKLGAPVEEVMGRFGAERALEVILLTESGSNHTTIEGIVTQWDAARYPS